MENSQTNFQIFKINIQYISEKSLDKISPKEKDWLNYYFDDEDIINIIKQEDRVKSLITLQAIYYLNIFKRLFISKLMGSKKNTELTSLPLINMHCNEMKSMSLKTLKHKTNPSESTINYRINRDTMSAYFNVGLIGCGRIGSYLLNKLMLIRENKEQIKFRILVSTRRPDDVQAEVYNNLSDDVEIFLDNERIFSECHLIFVCVQYHQFENIQIEIAETLRDRIETIKKKRDKTFPTIISCMAGVGIWKLRIMLGQEVNIQTTYIHAKTINSGSIIPTTEDDYGEDINNQRILKYSQEAFEHLFSNGHDFIENLFLGFHNGFYKNKLRKDSDVIVEEYSTELIHSIFGEFSHHIYEKFFDKETKKIKQDSYQLIHPKVKENFLNSIKEILLY